jgi:hypothetical protein
MEEGAWHTAGFLPMGKYGMNEALNLRTSCLIMEVVFLLSLGPILLPQKGSVHFVICFFFHCRMFFYLVSVYLEVTE